MGGERRELTGGGLRLVLDQEVDTENAERAVSAFMKFQGNKVRLDFQSGDGKQPVGEPLAKFINSGWGYVYYNGIKDEGVDAVLGWSVVSVGRDGDNGRLYWVPNRQHYDSGRVKNQAMYRLLHVYIDEDAVAQAAIDKSTSDAKRNLDVKTAELERYKQLANAGNVDEQIAIAKGEAGQGFHAIELSMNPGRTMLIVATSDHESAEAHGGISAIKAGTWEKLVGAKKPSDFNLPKPIIDATEGLDKINPATELFNSVVSAANEITPDYPAHYSSAWKAGARVALKTMGLENLITSA